MIIKSIKLKNFRSHGDSELVFGRGVSVLVGENGAGKSSILEAISFALFKQHVAKIDDLIRRGSGELEVELVFEHNGRSYGVVRKKRRNTAPESRLFMKQDDSSLGNLIQEGDRGVTEEIKQILKTDEALFLNAVYIRQGEIAGLLDVNASERKNIVGRLLGIDSLEKAWSRMPEVVRDFELRKMGIETELKEKENLKKELGDNEKELNARVKDESGKLKEVSVQEKTVEELLDKKRGFDDKKERFLKLSLDSENQRKALKEKEGRESGLSSKLKGIIGMEDELKELGPRVEEIPHMERLLQLEGERGGMEQEIKGLREELNQVTEYEKASRETLKGYEEYLKVEDELRKLTKEREEYAGLDRELRRVEEGIRRSREKITRLDGEVSDILTEASSVLEYTVDSREQLRKLLTSKKQGLGEASKGVDFRLTGMRDEVSGMKARNLELEKSVAGLREAKGKCPVCTTPLTEEHKIKLLEEYGDRKSLNDKEIRRLESEVKTLESEKKKLSVLEEAVNKVPVDLIESKSGEVLEERGVVRKQLDEKTRFMGGVEKLNELGSLSSGKEKLMQDFEADYRRHQSAQDFLSKYGGNRTGLESSLESVTGKLKRNRVEYQVCAGKLGGVSGDPPGELNKLRGLKSRFDELSGVVKEKTSLESELAELRSDVSGLREGVKKSSGELDALRYSGKEHEAVSGSLEASRKKLGSLVTERERLLVEIQGFTRNVDVLKQKLSDLTVREKELRKLNNFISFLSRLRKEFSRDGLQKIVRVKARPAIEQYTRELFNGFDMGYSSISVDDDYNIWLYGLDGSKSVDMISGGEKIAVALAFRLGIARALSGDGNNLLILDEPTIHLDSYRRQELVHIFRELKMLPQVILVTHEPELEGAADQLFKIEKRDGYSTCRVG